MVLPSRVGSATLAAVGLVAAHGGIAVFHTVIRKPLGANRDLVPAGVPLWRASLVVAMGVMATSLAQDKILGRIPLRNLLKNTLHLDRSASATFLFVIGFAWYVQPLFGAVVDAFPLFGSRRRSYMIIGSALVALGWTVAGFAAQAWQPLLVTMTLTCCAMVLVSCE